MADIYCTSCGVANPDISKFCTTCGYSLSNATSTQRQETVNYNRYPLIYEGEVPTRSYFKYIGPSLAIGFLTFFIIFSVLFGTALGQTLFNVIPVLLVLSLGASVLLIYYYYNNFADFQKMMRKYHPESPNKGNDPFLMLLVNFFFSPLFLYFKYDQLYKHFIEEHRDLRNEATNPMKIVALMLIAMFAPIIIMVIVFSLIFSSQSVPFSVITVAFGSFLVIPLVIAIYQFYLENHWQNTFNRHVHWHEADKSENPWLVS